MTKNEKDNPDIINASRRKRIARGSGRPVQEINRLLKQFAEMKKMMKQMTGGGKGKKGKNPFGNFKMHFNSESQNPFRVLAFFHTLTSLK